MTQDRPSAANLVETVGDFLRRLQPTINGQDRFYVRVSIHLLDIVSRELNQGAPYDSEETIRLEGLLARSGELASLNEELASRIREGTLDSHYAEVLDHVLKTIEDKLRIVNPQSVVQIGKTEDTS